MINYETLMLARTEITDDEISSLEKQIDKIITGYNGKMTLFDKWGKYKLAYPVRKNIYGVYILTRYSVTPESVTKFFDELNTLFKIKYNEIIMRNVTVTLHENLSSVYEHPEPIGSHRTSNLDSFIKENKMEGLIDTPVEKNKKNVESSGSVSSVDGVEDGGKKIVSEVAADFDRFLKEEEVETIKK